MKKRYYIGLANSVHDSSIAIVNNAGELVFAESTERYLQNKRSINVSPDHFGWTRELIGKYAQEADEFVLALSWSDNMLCSVESGIQELNGKSDIFYKNEKYIADEIKYEFYYGKFMSFSQQKMLMNCGTTFEFEMNSMPGNKARICKKTGWNHHLTHAATGCFSSGYDKAVCVIFDGYGEKNSVAVFQYDTSKKKLEDIFAYDSELSESCTGSLGMFYSLICRMCGFDSLKGEEWKVMGLACYGKFNQELYNLMSDYIWIEDSGIKTCSQKESMDVIHRLFKHAKKLGQSYLDIADIAFTGQKLFEDIFSIFIGTCYEKYELPNLVIGGGCALNSKANGMIIDNTGFDHLYVFSAPSDDGNSVGAALLSYYDDMTEITINRPMQHPYLGSCFSSGKLKQAMEFAGEGCVEYVGDMQFKIAAGYLKEGKIIAWANGRAEFGPRALGNRSIIANPIDIGIKDIINEKVKFREQFRPFAPSVLSEHASEYFESCQESPYMERTLTFREEMRDLVPGVVHFDNTGRLQTVSREWNKEYYQLIEEFYKETGIPVVLNTSFNIMGKPIIHSVEDAIGVFYTSGLDAMFIDGYYFKK